MSSSRVSVRRSSRPGSRARAGCSSYGNSKRPLAQPGRAPGPDDHVTRVFRRVAGSVPAACLAAVLCASRNAAAEEPATYEVKAAFLTNFAKFAEWPADTLPDGAP